SNAPSSEGATARAQDSVALLVSQVPGASLSRRRAVMVRFPAALTVAVREPSRAPSGARAVLPGPTRSRSLPLELRAREGDAGALGYAAAGVAAVKPAARAAVAAVQQAHHLSPAGTRALVEDVGD